METVWIIFAVAVGGAVVVGSIGAVVMLASGTITLPNSNARKLRDAQVGVRLAEYRGELMLVEGRNEELVTAMLQRSRGEIPEKVGAPVPRVEIVCVCDHEARGHVDLTGPCGETWFEGAYGKVHCKCKGFVAKDIQPVRLHKLGDL